MEKPRRRDVLRASGLAVIGSLAGCSGLVRGSSLPNRIPLYARNDRDEHVSLAYWCSSTASVPDDRDLDGVAQLESGEAEQLTEIPVEASEGEASRTPSQTSSQGENYPVTRSTGSNIGITADLQQRDDQRNVLLHVNPSSDVFSEAGYRITVLSEPIRDLGTPGQPVSHESVSSDEGITADYIRIAPREDE